MGKAGVIQRAFELARSGEITDTKNLQQVLRKEGFTHGEVAETTFPSIRKQLGDLVRASGPGAIRDHVKAGQTNDPRHARDVPA